MFQASKQGNHNKKGNVLVGQRLGKIRKLRVHEKVYLFYWILKSFSSSVRFLQAPSTFHRKQENNFPGTGVTGGVKGIDNSRKHVQPHESENNSQKKAGHVLKTRYQVSLNLHISIRSVVLSISRLGNNLLVFSGSSFFSFLMAIYPYHSKRALNNRAVISYEFCNFSLNQITSTLFSSFSFK